ncbi:MAG: ABC-2 family transporter protein, partial [Eubacteriales bacterium]|nr:ABC-2 family transporter protein [Eubacteriales bacterium]
IMPLPYSIQMLAGFFPFTCSGRFISGVILMCFAVPHLTVVLPWWWIFLLIGNIIISMVIIVGLSYLVSSLTFYAPVQCEEISSTVYCYFRSPYRHPLKDGNTERRFYFGLFVYLTGSN